MSERTAKLKRRETKGDFKSKQFFKPITFPLPNGEIDKDTGKQKLVETYIPRRQRRKMMRMLLVGLRKGRIDPRKLQEIEDRDRN